MHLLEVLREECGITSPKDGCSPQGFCGCCTVLRRRPSGPRLPEEARGDRRARGRDARGDPRGAAAGAGARVRAGGRGAVRLLHAGDRACAPPRCSTAARTADREAVATRARRPPVPLHRLPRGSSTRSAPRARRGRRAALCDRPSRAGTSSSASRSADRARPTRRPAAASAPSAPRYRGLEHALGEQAVRRRHARCRRCCTARSCSRRTRAPGCWRSTPAPALAMPGVVRVLTAADVPGRAARRPDRPGLAGVRRRGRDDPLRRRRAGARGRRLAVPRPARGRRGRGRVRGARARDLPRGGARARRARDPRRRQPARGVRVRPRRRRTRRWPPRPTSSRQTLHDPAHRARLPGARGVPRGAATGDRTRGLLAGPGRARRPASRSPPCSASRASGSTVELVANGGAFGGKEDLSIQAQTALAAHLLGRPVRTVLTREQSILLHPKRHPLTLRLHGRAATPRAGSPRCAPASSATPVRTPRSARRCSSAPPGHSCGPYRVPNVDVEARTVYTNNPPSGAMRGFGVNQAAFAIEGVPRHARRAGRPRRLRHPRAQRPRPRRPLRDRPDHDRRVRHPADARGGARGLQGERAARRHRLRDQEHRHRQRARPTSAAC